MSWSLDGYVLKSILVTRLRYLGDIVMSTTVLEVLRDGDPHLDLGYLCEEGFADVLADHPELQRVHRLRSGRRGSDARARAKSSPPRPGSHGTLGMAGELRKVGYDLAVDLFFNPRSAWLLKLAGIPQRIGGTRKWRGRLYTHRVLRSDIREFPEEFAGVAPGGLGEHLCRLTPLVHVETGESFISRLVSRFQPGDLCPRVYDPPLESPGIQGLERLGVDPARPFILLAPNATWPSKEWPEARWVELVSVLLDSQDFPLVVLSAPGREDGWTNLARAIPSDRGGVLPPLPLAEALAITASARAMVTVDGGLMHAAVGMGVPTLALFGPTDPAIWFPYEDSGPFRVLVTAPHCHPCNLHDCPEFICLPDLNPGRVHDSLVDLLDQSIPAGEAGR